MLLKRGSADGRGGRLYWDLPCPAPANQAPFAQTRKIHTTSYLPDINVWLSLSWGSHPHSATAWTWFRSLKHEELLYCRLTQIGLLRLLTTKAVMGDDCLTVKKAWGVYDRWLRAPGVEFRREPAEVDDLFRQATARLPQSSSPKALGDCYLLAMSEASNAILVTLDRGLSQIAGESDREVILLT